MDLTQTRRAAAVAQTVLQESKKDLIVDGKIGKFTFDAYNAAPVDQRSVVDRLLSALGVSGSIPAMYADYQKAKPVATMSNTASVFDLQVVPALVREARRRGIDPISAVTQIALESNYGKSTPRAEDGGPSYNYGGIKWNAVKTARKAVANTREVLKGASVIIKDAFAVFESPDDFARQYFAYLLSGPSSYRYKGLEKAKSPFEFGQILQSGGYATDPQYAAKFEKVANSVARRYSLA